MTLLEMFNSFSERDREIYLIRSRPRGYRDYTTYKKIGERFNLSIERTRQIHLTMDRRMTSVLTKEDE